MQYSNIIWINCITPVFLIRNFGPESNLPISILHNRMNFQFSPENICYIFATQFNKLVLKVLKGSINPANKFMEFKSEKGNERKINKELEID